MATSSPFFDENPVEKPDRLQSGPRTLHRHVARSGQTSHTGGAWHGLVARATPVLVVLALGCGDGAATVSMDGGLDVRPPCSGQPICEGMMVRACGPGGVAGATIDDCSRDGACSFGRCMSAACAAAERDGTSHVGCLFYTVQVHNVASDEGADTSFLVANPGTDSATIKLEQPAADGTWSVFQQATVAGGGAARLSASGFQDLQSGVHLGSGLRLESSRPVTVAQITSDDAGEDALSSAGTTLLPVRVLGTHYLVMAYQQFQTAAIASTMGSDGGAGRILIVGTQEQTHVTFTPSSSARALDTGSTMAAEPGDPLTFVLGDGDVFQAWTDGDREDLSGSEIVASRPVAVFSGNISTTYGKTAPGIHSPDMAHEQIPPVARWSLKYVAASLPPQAGTCDTLLGQTGSTLWRLLAAHDGTRVDFEGPPGGGQLPSTLTLAAGEVHEIVAIGDFVVTASEPLLLTQGMDCEPTLSLAISGDKLLDDVWFSVLPSFDQVVAIARKAGTPVMLDDRPVDDALFTPAGGGFEVARVALPICAPSAGVCAHHLDGQVGMTLRGMDVLASYALTAPAWSGCIDQQDLTCVM